MTAAFARLAPTAPEHGIVAAIPHTGTWMPGDLTARLASDAVRALPMTDWHLHELYDFLPALGVPVIHATVSRFVVDLNRSPEPLELYPGRMETGVVPVETFWGETVWSVPPDAGETAALIEAWHRPYHDALHAELERVRSAYGRVLLLDLHSVASRASRIHGELEQDIYLGDRDGTTCDPAIVSAVERVYRDAGLRVVRNDPYKGGFTTHHYGALDAVDALQIEMVQRVYMDEVRPEGALGGDQFSAAKALLREVFSRLVATHTAAPTTPV